MNVYTQEGDIIYDPFMGTGTTGLACKLSKRQFIGSEISKSQVDYSNERIKEKLL